MFWRHQRRTVRIIHLNNFSKELCLYIFLPGLKSLQDNVRGTGSEMLHSQERSVMKYKEELYKKITVAQTHKTNGK